MHDSHPFISGEVQIHAGAIVAAGVVLQAEDNSAIAIENGACIGAGSVIHASGGSITISEGAILGSNVLLVGSVSIGAQACIGSASTVMDAAISPGMMLPSGSLILCDPVPVASLHISSVSFEAEVKSFTTSAPSPTQAVSDPWGDAVDQGADFASDRNGNNISGNNISATPPTPPPHSPPEPPSNSQPGATAMYGKVRLNKLLMTLLPHRQADYSIAPPPSDDD